jgi:hypothetical protein
MPREPRSRRRDDDEDDDDRPRSRRRRDEDDDDDDRPRRGRRSEPASNPWLIWGPVLGLLLIGGGVGAYFAFKPKKKTDDTSTPVVQNNEERKDATAPKDRFPVKDAPVKNSGPFVPKVEQPPKFPKVEVPPPPKVDDSLVKARDKQVRLDATVTNIERFVVADNERGLGVCWSNFEGGRKNSYFDFFDVTSGKKLGRLDLPDTTQLQSLALSPDGALLLTTEIAVNQLKNVVNVYLLAEKKPLLKNWQPYPKELGGQGLLYADFVRPELLVTVTAKRQVNFWATSDGKEAGSVQVKGTDTGLQFTDPYSHYWKDIALNPDRSVLALWNGGGFTLVDTAGMKELGATEGVTDIASNSMQVVGCCFNPDGQSLVAWITSRKNPNALNPENFLVTFDVGTRKNVKTVQFEAADFLAQVMRFWGPKHILLYRGVPSEGVIINAETGRPVRMLMGPFTGKLSFLQNGSLWYVGSEGNQTPAYANRIDFPEKVLADADPWEPHRAHGTIMKRLWLNAQGASTKPGNPEFRLESSLIRRPKG